ncbi:HAD-IA family hydrolase [Stenotrophomonas rhizophila]|uniref:HAD-IA family hydrolase n=1 Tax=Stenotrophomonas rhizophila TaxID=216778 RepID=UPI001E29E2DE|nr:HAD-IA family hydrolase [Stenotrophomonas rhizophila]MCC7635666.1 HAD-IA family hydrolase [Stenotrophomonas rhizophila]MCC7664781.1 HAD-IA family hydrolase [Stenotrophomonas rhizophila]
MPPVLDCLLLDFDGVLVRHARHLRARHLAASLGCSAAQIQAALFDSGLEQQHDAGLDSTDYLQQLGVALHTSVSVAHWQAARIAASPPQTGVIERVQRIARRLPIAILTNNGALMAQTIPLILPTLATALHGRILCSGALGGRKPDPAVYVQALARLGVRAERTLFIDDLFVNVRGARLAGLHAETANDSRGFNKVLKRYGLAAQPIDEEPP